MKHLSRFDIEAIADKYVQAYMALPDVRNTQIGRDKLYEMTSQEKCPFVLWVGNRRMIKRRVFDEYIEKMYSI